MSGSERSFIFDDLIQLPRFDAAGAVALGERLLHVANAEAELPRTIRRAKEALTDDLAALRRAAAARLASASASDPAAGRSTRVVRIGNDIRGSPGSPRTR